MGAYCNQHYAIGAAIRAAVNEWYGQSYEAGAGREYLGTRLLAHLTPIFAAHDAELKQDLKDQLGWMEQSEVEAFVAEKVRKGREMEAQWWHDAGKEYHCAKCLDTGMVAGLPCQLCGAVAGKGELK